MTRTPRTEAARLAALDELLARPRASWGEVMTLLAWWPAAQGQAEAVARVEAVEERWPEPTRVLPRIGARHLLEGKAPPYLRLVRALDLRPLWRARRRVLLLSRMIHEAGLRRLHSFEIRYDEGKPISRLLVRHIEGLRMLYLGACSLDSEGAASLAAAPSLAGLRSLSLHSNQIDDEGALALLASPWLRGLGYLNLYNNRISPAVAEQLRQAPQWQGATLLLNAQRR